jgi:hypothetical protein
MELTKTNNQEQAANLYEGELLEGDLQAVVGGTGGTPVDSLLETADFALNEVAEDGDNVVKNTL